MISIQLTIKASHAVARARKPSGAEDHEEGLIITV